MSTLVIENSRFYRVKKGQTGADVEGTLKIPAPNAYAGAILPLEEFTVHKALPFDSYESLAEKYGVEVERLKRVNGGKPIYPSCRVYVPRNNL